MVKLQITTALSLKWMAHRVPGQAGRLAAVRVTKDYNNDIVAVITRQPNFNGRECIGDNLISYMITNCTCFELDYFYLVCCGVFTDFGLYRPVNLIHCRFGPLTLAICPLGIFKKEYLEYRNYYHSHIGPLGFSINLLPSLVIKDSKQLR